MKKPSKVGLDELAFEIDLIKSKVETKEQRIELYKENISRLTQENGLLGKVYDVIKVSKNLMNDYWSEIESSINNNCKTIEGLDGLIDMVSNGKEDDQVKE